MSSVLVQTLVLSQIDYCNSVLNGLPKSTLSPFTYVIHTGAHLVKNLSTRDHITSSLHQPHWLPIQARISFKICLLMFKVKSGSAPPYMSSLVIPYAGPAEWNSLPEPIQRSSSINTFKTKLKTYLFSEYYD